MAVPTHGGKELSIPISRPNTTLQALRWRPGKPLAEGAGQRAGQPPRVLMLHGWMDNAATFGPLADSLAAAGCDVVAIDLPGHGRSPHLRDGIYLATTYAQCALGAAHSLGWVPGDGTADAAGSGVKAKGAGGKGGDASKEEDDAKSEGFHLVGHSLGGGVACLAAGALGTRLQSMVLLDSMGLLTRPSAALPGALWKAFKTVADKAGAGAGAGAGGSRSTAPFESLLAAGEYRASTAGRLPGPQRLSLEGAMALVGRGTRALLPDEGEGEGVGASGGAGQGGKVLFRHDQRLKDPSDMYLCEEQMLAFLRELRPRGGVLLVRAEEGIPFPEGAAEKRLEAMRVHGTGVRVVRVPGWHHAHLDPEHRGPVLEAVGEHIRGACGAGVSGGSVSCDSRASGAGAGAGKL